MLEHKKTIGASMRAVTITLLVLILIAGGALGSVALAENAEKCMSWYCKREKNHVCPKIEPEMSFIGEYGGAYLGNTNEKVIYLTFDAGYENGNVEKILDTLKAHKAPGAFFVLDNLIRRNGELVARMAAEGHTVCNHTRHHRDMTTLSREQFSKEISELSELYKSATGLEMAPVYRPPEGKFSRQNLIWANEMGYKTLFWSLAYADWDNNNQPDAEKAKELLRANIHNGAVLLLHPTSATNAEILDSLLTEWEKEGYRFGSINELFESVEQ